MSVLWCAAIFGIPLHIGHFVIDILWQLWIIHGECKSDDSSNEILESVLYGLINVLQIIELIVFIFCVGYHWNTIYKKYIYIEWSEQSTTLHQRLWKSVTDHPLEPYRSLTSLEESGSQDKLLTSSLTNREPATNQQSNQSETCKIQKTYYFLLCLFMAVILIIGVATSALGYYRDEAFYNTTDSCKLPNGTSRYKGLAIAHAVVTAFTIFIPGVVRIAVLVLLGYAKKCWNDSLDEISNIKDKLETSYEKLSYHYQCIGEQVRVIYNALEAWFLLQFMLYSVLLTTDLIHIIGPSYTHKSNIYDEVHTIIIVCIV